METRTLQSGRVLIIDDQEGNIRLLERILASAGYTEIKAVTDPRKVTALYQEWAPDLILLDMMMPHLDGFEVMKQLQPLIPPESYLPILAITADVEPGGPPRPFFFGRRKDFLNKPIDRTEVLLRIANLLETRFLHLKVQEHNRTLEESVRQRTAEVREQATLIAKARDAILVRDLCYQISFWNEGRNAYTVGLARGNGQNRWPTARDEFGRTARGSPGDHG